MQEEQQELEQQESPTEEASDKGAPVETAVTFRDDEGGRVRNYDELDGNEGRSVFFRPHRFSAADLEPLGCAVEVELEGGRLDCALRDVSQSGVAFAWGEAPPPRQGQRLRLALRFDGYQAFRGEATVGSVRVQDGTVVVGALFHEFLLDVDEVLQLREVRAWSASRQGARLADRPWNVAGQDRFKSLVAEMRLFIEDAEGEFNALEERLPWHVLNGPANPARTALVSRIRHEFVAEMVRQSEAIDAALRQVPGGLASPMAREWSLRNLDKYWMASPSCRWTKNKPYGYPGDYEVMGFLYERQFEGPTLFAKVMGLVFLSTRTAQAVRCRKDLVKRQILDMLQQRAGSGQPLRVLSVAAGPAQELYELFATMDELPAPLEVVLFEQDKNALAHAWRRLRATAEARFPRQVRLTYLHDSVKRLLRDATLFQEFGRFDLVYSSGLLDYFQRNTGVVLSRRLAAAVKPGGHLLMANMVDHPTRWLMEWHLDWNLIYRTRQELLEIGHRAVPDAELRILEEETGINPFFELTPH